MLAVLAKGRVRARARNMRVGLGVRVGLRPCPTLPQP